MNDFSNEYSSKLSSGRLKLKYNEIKFSIYEYNEEQAAAARQVMAEVGELIAPSTREVNFLPYPSSQDFENSQLADYYSELPEIRFSKDGSHFVGSAQFSEGGSIVFLTQWDRLESALPGNYGYHTLLHEVGHALGLRHTHESEFSRELDHLENSVMSYRSFPGDNSGYNNELNSWPQTFMPYDILSLQKRYGADYSTRSEDSVYTWSPVDGSMRHNGALVLDGEGKTINMTIWDGGGVDQYDLSAFSEDLKIDLNPGAGSSFGNSHLSIVNKLDGQLALASVYNAFLVNGDARSIIENAKTGNGNDIVIGNDFGNEIFSGSGHDKISSKGGSDLIRAGAGNDKAYAGSGRDQVWGGRGADILSGGAGADTLFGGAGGDRLHGSGGADTLKGAHGNDIIRGGYGTDTIFGGPGSDLIFGEFGSDRLYGGAGRDAIYGGNGNDHIYGEGGINILHGGSGNDVIHGGPFKNSIRAGSGDDAVYIDGKFNYVKLGTGHDQITFSEAFEYVGVTKVSGGAGDDFFEFHIASDSARREIINPVIITDFEINKDSIRISDSSSDVSSFSVQLEFEAASGTLAHVYKYHNGDKYEVSRIFLDNVKLDNLTDSSFVEFF